MDRATVAGFYQMICATLSPPGRSTPMLHIHETMESSDRLACRFTMSGVHSGPFINIPASGKPYALPGITMMRFANRRVVERRASADMPGLLAQIGAVPPPC
jgi:predicted ester cyclase